MARTRKSIQPLNLHKYDVLIEDRGPRSDYFKISQFDGYFYGGRNAFLIAGASILQPGSKILIEILNSDGTTVYSAPIASFIEGSSRLIQVEVYSDTPIGPGKIVVLGCADYYLDGTEIPATWKDKYNVRWITDVIISPLVQNKTPIRFVDPPNITVQEKFYLAPFTSSYSQSILVPADVELTPKYYNIFQNGYLIRIASPPSSVYSDKFIGGKLTGSIQFVGPAGPETASISLPITKIYNSTLAESNGTLIYTNKNTLLQDGFLSSSGQYVTRIEPFGEVGVTSSVSLKYDQIISFDTGSSSSYAEIRLTDLNTLSGEIFKTKISYKSATTPSNYTIIGDVPIEVRELLAIDSGSKIAEIGKFTSIVIDDYWYAATMSVDRTDINPTIPDYYLTSSTDNYLPIKQRSNDLLDAIDAVPTIINAAYENTSFFIGTKPEASISLFPRSEYTVKFDAMVSRVSSSVEWSGTDASFEVYLIQEIDSPAKLLETNPKGQLLGTLVPSKNFKKQRFDGIEFNFTPKIVTNGKFGLRFIGYGGFWNIANVSVKPATEPLFSPNEAVLLLPNEFKYNDLLIFKAEYLDVNNNSTKEFTLSLPTYFTGSVVQRFVSGSGGGGTGAGFPYSGSAVITGSLLISGSGLFVTGSTQFLGSVSASQFTGTASFAETASVGLVAKAVDIIGGSIGDLQTSYTGSLFGTSSFSISSSQATTASYVSSVASIAFVINGGSNPVSTGFKGSIRIPTNSKLADVALYTSGSGSVNVDLVLQDHDTYNPSILSGTSIVGTPLSMSNNTKYLDTSLSGWTTQLLSDDIINFIVREVSGAEIKVVTVVFNLIR